MKPRAEKNPNLFGWDIDVVMVKSSYHIRTSKFPAGTGNGMDLYLCPVARIVLGFGVLKMMRFWDATLLLSR